MKRFATVIICAVALAPAAAASVPVSPLLKRAAIVTGLKVRHPVGIVRESSARFDRDAARIFNASYPRGLQQFDDELYAGLGLLPEEKSIRSILATKTATARALYDPVARVVRVRRKPAAGRAAIVGELARALVDQNYNLERLKGLRQRDRDAALAAQAVVDGTVELTGSHTQLPHDTPLDRFLSLEQSVGDIGRNLLTQLRYLGGRPAMKSALRSFPQTTEQLLHVDKFLEREPAQNVSLTSTINEMRLSGSEAFGELDVMALLRAYDLPNADSVAAGWGGGRIGLYSDSQGASAVALVLRWDTSADAEEWRGEVSRYVGAVFPDATARVCPAVDACWLDGTRELASVTVRDLSVFASGSNAELVAAKLAGLSS